MADRIEAFQVTVPADTLAATPADTDLNFNRGRVDRMEIVVPPGPSGLVGFAVVHSQQQIIPFADGEFIVADNEILTWDLSRYPEASPWTIRAYNTDVYDHTLYIRLHLTDVATEPAVDVSPQYVPPGGTSELEFETEAPLEELIGEELGEGEEVPA